MYPKIEIKLNNILEYSNPIFFCNKFLSYNIL